MKKLSLFLLADHQLTTLKKGEGKMKRLSLFLLVFGILFFGSKVQSQPIPLPTEFRLYQNIPNPFGTAGTTISFLLPTRCFVELSIYKSISSTSIPVIRLDSSMRDAGLHSLFWDARDQRGNFITPGSYYCEMIASAGNTQLFRGSIQMEFYYDAVSVEDKSPEKLSCFTLFQNFPNPFNPATTIEYSVSRLSHIRLSVLNALGQEVAVLVDEKKLPGRYEVYFNASHLSSGVYFYRLWDGDFSKTKKLVLLK